MYLIQSQRALDTHDSARRVARRLVNAEILLGLHADLH